MPYSFKFINKLQQLGMVHYTLVLNDTDNLLPTYSTSVLLKESENTENKLKQIAEAVIAEKTSNYTK